jgi:hypothetical protein
MIPSDMMMSKTVYLLLLPHCGISSILMLTSESFKKEHEWLMTPYRYPVNLMSLHPQRQVNAETLFQGKSCNIKKCDTEFARVMQQQVDTLQHHQKTAEPAHMSHICKADAQPELQKLGKITQSVPTVSDLLIRHPEYKNDCWQIIYSKANIDKPYTRIPVGTDIYLDPVTRELVWGETNSRKKVASHPEPVSSPVATAVPSTLSKPEEHPSTAGTVDTFTDDLVDVVRSFIGTPYQKMDCYEMVVEGLQGMGVRYHGKGGLAEHLKDMATREGRYRYAYFNGEGLLQASGADVFSRTIPSVKNHDAETKSLMEEIAPILKKGMLLSFSTTTRGHTGIISQKDSDWTFINSGWMDHEIENRPRRKAVGEENLNAEIRNWLQRAARQKEPLQITLGRLDEDALNSFRMRQASLPGSSLSRKI